MTRFARAKGSKASNERLPEEATSWSEMKQDLLNKNKEITEQQNRETVLKQRQANYQAFLQEKEDEKDKKTSWADFPNIKSEGNQKRKGNSSKTPSSKMKTNNHNSTQLNEDIESEDSDGQFGALKLQIDKVLAKEMETNCDSDEPPEEVSIKEKPKEITITKVKKRKQKLRIVLSNEEQLESSPQKKVKLAGKEMLNGTSKGNFKHAPNENNKKLQGTKGNSEKQKLSANNKSSEKSVGKEILTEKQQKLIEKKIKRKKKQEAKRKLKKQALKDNRELKNNSESDLSIVMQKEKPKNNHSYTSKDLHLAREKHDNGFNGTNKQLNNNQKFNDQSARASKPFQKLQSNQKQKKTKVRDDKEHNSRKLKPLKMFINGKTVEIDYIDGFPVKKEDAERLKKLRKEMISKGLPRSEINIALKLERRRAEKAFAREKKNVCFNCRKSGHNLSECPELDKDQVVQSGTGICFKCGSTEHTHFECKVIKGLDYKFATCFICKEQGHIAKQCPDNQRGLYPKGGSCKVCGDVTHLKKDCPKYQAQQSQLQNSLSIDVMNNGNPEDLGEKRNSKSFNQPAKRLNKVIKF